MASLKSIIGDNNSDDVITLLEDVSDSMSVDNSALNQRVAELEQKCVDVETAIDAYTYESAYCEFQEDVKGRIKPGYYADLVLLDTDIFTCDPLTIKDILPIMTMVDGKVVYEK